MFTYGHPNTITSILIVTGPYRGSTNSERSSDPMEALLESQHLTLITWLSATAL